MPAFIAHMVISRRVRDQLCQDPEIGQFVKDVMNNHANYMELGSSGPDLPYYGTLKSLVKRNKPLGVDQWSYQLHAKDPNVFPLKMLEIIWKESDLTKADWAEIDSHKLAFLFGFLTHVAADQVIHPLVDAVAGSYEKRKEARDRHQRCEVHQDLYLLAKSGDGTLPRSVLDSQKLNLRCKPTFPQGPQGCHICPIEFTYLVQKSFVEAHAVKPYWLSVESWIRGFLFILWKFPKLTPYKEAYSNLFDTDGQLKSDAPEYKKYIDLDGIRDKIPTKKTKNNYDAYVDEAVATASAYLRAAIKVIMPEPGKSNLDNLHLDDASRMAFLEVVRRADLTAPLEDVNSADAIARVQGWDKMVAKYQGQQFLPS